MWPFSKRVSREGIRTQERQQKFRELEQGSSMSREMLPSAKALWLTSRANYEATQGYLDDAISDCREAISLKPDHLPAWMALGLTYNAQGRPQEALATFKRAPRTLTLLGETAPYDPELLQQLDTWIHELEPRKRGRAG